MEDKEWALVSLLDCVMHAEQCFSEEAQELTFSFYLDLFLYLVIITSVWWLCSGTRPEDNISQNNEYLVSMLSLIMEHLRLASVSVVSQ